VSQPTKYQQPQWGNLQTRIYVRVAEIHLFIPSSVEKFSEFNGEFIFQIRAKMADVTPENPVHGGTKQPKKSVARKLLLQHGRL